MILVYKIYANAIDVWALALARYTILDVHCDWDSTQILSGLAVCFCLLARKWSRCAIWLCRWMCVCDSLVYIQFVLVNCNDTAGFFSWLDLSMCKKAVVDDTTINTNSYTYWNFCKTSNALAVIMTFFRHIRIETYRSNTLMCLIKMIFS